MTKYYTVKFVFENSLRTTFQNNISNKYVDAHKFIKLIWYRTIIKNRIRI